MRRPGSSIPATRVSRRQHRAEQAVAEFLAARRRCLGRQRRRPHGGAIVVRRWPTTSRPAEYHFINASAPPFGNRSRVEDPPGLFDDPYRTSRRRSAPIADRAPTTPFRRFGAFGAIDPDINSPRVQSWNVTVERQIGTDWGASVELSGQLLGSALGAGRAQSRRVPGPRSVHDRRRGLPGVHDQREPRTSGACCTLENPAEAQFIGALDLHTDVGTQDYRGLKLSVRRRAASGVSLNGNYTWSRCWATRRRRRFSQISSGYMKPDDPGVRSRLLRPGPHAHRQRHGRRPDAASSTNARAARAGVELARVGHPQRALGQLAERHDRPRQRVHRHQRAARQPGLGRRLWRQDAGQLPEPGRVRAAGAGTFGNFMRNSVKGPGFWTVDLALSRLFSFGGTQNARVARRGVQPAQQLQLGQSDGELRRRRSSAGSRRWRASRASCSSA